ncbi:metal-dependent hydrolase [Candidatus Latescibacterota bacterium]
MDGLGNSKKLFIPIMEVMRMLKRLLIPISLIVIALLVLVSPVKQAEAWQEGKVEVQMIGFGCLKITSPEGTVILLDPWFGSNDFFPDGNPAIPMKYKKNIREFGKVDIVLITHAHFDHLDLEDVQALVHEFDAVVIAPVETCCYMSEKLGPEISKHIENGGFGMNHGPMPAPIKGVHFTGVPAFHSSSELKLDSEGRIWHRDVGNPLGYIITFSNGFKIYVSGDTGLFGDMKTIIGDYYKPDLAILNVCGGGLTIGGDSAAFAVKLLGVKHVISAHYGVFAMMDQTPEKFINACKKRARRVKIYPLQSDEAVEF